MAASEAPIKMDSEDNSMKRILFFSKVFVYVRFISLVFAGIRRPGVLELPDRWRQ